MDDDRNPAAAPAERPRRRRRWRWFLFAVVLVAAVPLLLPYALNLTMARQWVERQLARNLDTACRIDRLAFSWFSGFELGGVEIGNSRGFDPSHPCLAFDSLRGDLSLARLLRGRLDLSGTLAGLRLHVDQDADGHTNLAQLFDMRIDIDRRRRGGTDPSADGGEVAARHGIDLADVRLDLELTRAEVQFRRDGELLESLRDLDCRLEKEFGTQTLRVRLDARMPPTRGEREGRLHLSADIDGQALAGEADLETNGLDLARYQPLASVWLRPGELTAIAGVVDGHLTMRFSGSGHGSLSTQGQLTVTGPRLAGSLLSGLDVAGELWTLRPDLELDFAGVGPPRIDSSDLDLDFGFLRLRGLDDAALQQQLSGTRGIGCAYTLDLAALSRFGGDTAIRSGTITGTLALPLPGDELPDAKAMLRALLADAELRAVRSTASGFQLADLDGTLALRDGKVVLATSPQTAINGGPLRLDLRVDLTGSDELPFTLELDWRGGQVAGETTAVLRHLVPLLAGLDAVDADFAAAVDLDLRLQGPLRPRPGETVLQWLDHWSGDGRLQLTGGSFVPAPALRELLTMLGQQERLAIDQLDGGFTLRQGQIETKVMRWVSKGQQFGLRGTVGLDGVLDFGLDLTAILQQHRDGRVIAALLGEDPLLAGLDGTLDAPVLALPDLAALAQRALEKAPAKLLEQQGQELLRRGLEKLFGGRKQD